MSSAKAEQVRGEGRLLSPSLLTLYLDTFLMAVGFFMLVPLIGVYLLEHLAWSVTLAGFVIAVRGFGQQGMMVFCGMAADRIGYKRAILVGVAIRAAGFALYGFVQHPAGLIFAALIAGLGGALFHPASYAAYATLSDESTRVRIYSIRETLSNVGNILGPVIGTFLLKFDFALVCYAAAFMFLAAFLVTLLLLPDLSAPGTPRSYLEQLRQVTRREFLLFTLLMTGMWMLFVQLYVAVPFRAQSVLADVSMVGYIYTGGAVFMVLLQYGTVRFLERHFRPLRVIAAGTLLLGLALFGIGRAEGFIGLQLSVLLFTLGQMITQPMMNNVVSRFAHDGAVASYFGFNGLGLSLGGLLGNTGGGFLYDLARTNPSLSWLPWAVFLIIGAAVALGLLQAARSKTLIPGG